MSNIIKACLALAAIFAVIALGLFWPTDDAVSPDPFAMRSDAGAQPPTLNPPGERPSLESAVPLETVYSSMADIRSGRFKYRAEDNSWRFTIPIDWGKPHDMRDVNQVIQRLAFADPFLRSYAQAGNIEDFQQAAFFLLDWQSYYQDGRQTTPYAWDVDAAEGRAARLAYILREISAQPNLLSENGTNSLLKLADFHVQRMTDPVYGQQQDTILKTPAFIALCGAVQLSSCTTSNEGN